MRRICKRGLCFVLTLILTAGLLPGLGTGAAAMTLEERQQAVVAVAMAYYEKGQAVQYDGATIVDVISRSDGGKTRSTNQVPPEYATPKETMYSVCSDFAHQVYWETCRYSLCGSAGANWTKGLCRTKGHEQEEAWFWDAETSANKDRNVAIDEMLAVAQPGDVFTSIHKNGGHTMVYVGDVLGDGVKYIVHCWGADNRKAKKKGLVDVIEYAKGAEIDKRYDFREYSDTKGGGAIRLCPASEFIHKTYGKESQIRMNLIRPFMKITENDYPITEATKYRVSHPRLAIDRYLNITRFNSVETGETVTMTLKLSNSSKTDYTVPVTEKTPVGATVKTPFAGAEVSDGVMKWDVALKAGEEKTFTCEYEITAKRGEKVVFEGGSVGDIPSNTIPITVGGKKLTAEDKAKLAAVAKGEYNKALADAGATSPTLGNTVYQKILGLNVQLPEFEQVAKGIVLEYKTKREYKTNRFKTIDEVAAEDRTACQMMVPQCWGGGFIRYEWGIERCLDPRDRNLEPGDVIYRASDVLSATIPEQLVYLGDGKYLTYDKNTKTYPIAEEPEYFVSLVDYKIFFVMRPTLAFDDVHALPELAAATKTLRFTDVRADDWFCKFVEDLAADGTVSGMTETTFEPNGTLTYGQALKLIALALGEGEQAATGDNWASGYLKLAKEKGWIKGNVNLNGPITRLALCEIVATAKKLEPHLDKSPFTDTKAKSVRALYTAGIVSGVSATEFKPEGLLTRAQIAKIIWTLKKI